MNPRSSIRTCVFWAFARVTSVSARAQARHRFLLIAAICILSDVRTTKAQVFPVDPVGYANLSLSMGQSLIGNPFDAEDNSLNGIFDPLSVPQGTMLTKWDAANGQYLPTSVFTSGSWSINYMLPPGEGALLNGERFRWLDQSTQSFQTTMAHGTTARLR
jgi:hypothetical protein